MNLSENYFIELAKNNPLELKEYLIGSKSDQVIEGLKSFGAEACQYIEDHQLAKQILLPLFTSAIIVQEGVIYGLLPHIDQEVFYFLQEKLYNEFTHPMIKEIISDYLNDFDILIQVLESLRNLPESPEDYDSPPNDLAINNAKEVLQKISNMSLENYFNLKDLDIDYDAMGGIAIQNEKFWFSFMNDGHCGVIELQDTELEKKFKLAIAKDKFRIIIAKMKKDREEQEEKWKLSKDNPENWTENQKQEYIEVMNFVNSLE